MLRADAGSIPVLESGRLIGMVTDRDIAVRGIAEGRGPDTPVRELMSGGTSAPMRTTMCKPSPSG